MPSVKEERSLNNRKEQLREAVWIIHTERAPNTHFIKTDYKDYHHLGQENVSISNLDITVLASHQAKKAKQVRSKYIKYV